MCCHNSNTGRYVKHKVSSKYKDKQKETGLHAESNIKLGFSSALSDLVHFSDFLHPVSEPQSHCLNYSLKVWSSDQPWHLLEIWILRPQTRPSELEKPGWGFALCFNKLSVDADAHSSGELTALPEIQKTQAELQKKSKYLKMRKGLNSVIKFQVKWWLL